MDTEKTVAACIQVLDMILEINNGRFASAVLYPLDILEIADAVERHFVDKGFYVKIVQDEELAPCIDLWVDEDSLTIKFEEATAEPAPLMAMAAGAWRR